MKQYTAFCKSALLLFCVVLLGGCGKESHGSDSGRVFGSRNEPVSDTEQLMAYKNIRYLPEFTDTSNDYDALAAEGAGFVDDTFYLIKREISRTDYGYAITGGQVIAYDPDTREEKALLDAAGRNAEIITAAPLEDGSVIALYNSQDTGYELCRVDAGGKEIFSAKIPFSGELLNCEFAADSQGRSYLLAGGEILLYNEKGAAAGKIDVAGKWTGKIVCGKNGSVYLYERSANQLLPVDFETASLGTSAHSLPISMLREIAATDREGADFLVCDAVTVYQYSCEDGILTPLFDLQDSQILYGSNIDTIGEMSDGRIFLFTRDGDRGTTEAVRLTPTPLAECPVKDVITIGSIYPDRNLLESVAEFNRQNEDFSVSVINYCTGGRNFREAREAFRLDISIGKGPDLCDLDSFPEAEDLYASGCFADLTPYLEGSSRYGREDFVSQALEACTWEGQLMAIPKYFNLYTLVGSSDLVGEAMGWDMDDVKALIESHRDALIFDSRPGSYMFSVLIRNMLGEFVDFQGGKADFDSEEYINFLNFINDLPDNFTEREESEYPLYGDKWLQEGQALLSCREIYGVLDLQKFDYIFEGGYTCIGFPSPDKIPDCIMKPVSAYAISSVSPDQDRAWRFLEWNHSTQGGEMRDPLLRGGFPSRTEVFERELKEAMGETEGHTEKGGFALWDGLMVRYRDASSEEAGLLYAMIESARPEKSTQKTILEIMEEEAAWLFDGSKSAEDVAEVTQNRVQLYLDER